MHNIDSYNHTRGGSIYLDDIPVIAGTLYAACFDSPIAHGTINFLDTSIAEKYPGVVRIITYKDITGENQVGGIIPDEELLAHREVHFCGMPVALVVAATSRQARNAVKAIKIDITPLPVITDPREAAARDELIVPARTFKLGDCNSVWSSCDYIFEGKADTNGQEHLYIETQGAYTVPQESGGIKVYSSTQGPTAVQRTVSRVTGLPMHQVEVDVARLGGGFGGKEDQANTWAALCGLATHLLKKPVKYTLDRMEDIRMTGKRHPYSSDFKIGLTKDLKIIAYEVIFYQNAGAAADLSPAVLDRTLFHATNSYFVPNVTAKALSCRTNLPPNTAFRGFGGPQGMFVMEAAIAKAADGIGVHAYLIQQQNLLQTGDEFLYGQKVQSEAGACWQKATAIYNLDGIRKQVADFNKQHLLHKKGVALMPVCFGISFTNTLMNQGAALVHVYTDGSVAVSTGAVEMGQGVNTKMLQVVAETFSIDPAKIKVNTTNTYRVANTSPSAASSTADLNGKATELACAEIITRLKKVAAEELQVADALISIQSGWVHVDGVQSALDWNKLVVISYNKRTSLTGQGYYSTPGIHFDKTSGKGHPFAYHVFGTAIITVTVDCLRGIYEVDSVKLVHDFGSTMNPIIDRGQVEGAVVQGIGWMTIEELMYDRAGKLLSNALSTYKVPDICSAPKEIVINFLETGKDNPAIFKSKAVGEPPLMYGIGVFFALRNAIKSFNPQSDPPFASPMTPEKMLLNLYPEAAEKLSRQKEPARKVEPEKLIL